MYDLVFFFFFFQAEDGIRDGRVTGVQTCALPIYREPKQLHGRMNEGISRETPDLAASQDTSTVEHHEIKQTAAGSRDEETSHDRKDNMDADKNRRDIHRKTPHPRDRPIIVGSGHSEHALNKQPRMRRANAFLWCWGSLSPTPATAATTMEKILGEAAEAGKIRPSRDR